MLKVKNEVNLKCNKCRHYYRGASFGGGYNPIPCCHRLEDTGVRANPLTCECFEKRVRR